MFNNRLRVAVIGSQRIPFVRSFREYSRTTNQEMLTATLQANGFAMVAGARRAAPFFDIWVLATKAEMDGELLKIMAVEYFPK